ncbi:MAG: HisA/HisF-related TIM barrel protein [Methylococcales bacterium]
MEIIPVIDIMQRKAVHAKRGLRELYRPLHTPLCPDGEPVTLATGFLSLYGFRTIYIADLDALMGKGSNFRVIQDLIAHFPTVEFWIDRGLSDSQFQDTGGRPWMGVLGSESLSESGLARLDWRSGRMILSLDFAHAALVGPKLLLENELFWPQRVIIMNLSGVGSNEGPDWECCEYFRALWPHRQLFAAGGLRGERDLRRLASLGFIGALCATALHNGALGRGSIARMMSQ